VLQDDLDNQKLRPFLSIRWKLFLALTCLVIIIHVAFLIGFYSFQSRVFKENTQNLKSEQIKALDLMIRSEQESLYRALSALPFAYPATSYSTYEQLSLKISQGYLPQGSFDGMALYDQHGNVLMQWGNKRSIAKSSLIKQLALGEQLMGLHCNKNCSLYASYALKLASGEVALISAFQEVSPLFKRFNLQNNLDVGLFKRFPAKGTSEAWDEVFFEATHRDSNIPILMHLPLEQHALKEGVDYLVSVFENEFSITFDSLVIRGQGAIKWAFIQNITFRTKQFEHATVSIFTWGAGSLALSLFILYIIINRISYQLPRILAMSQAIGLEDDAVNSVNKSGDKRILDDELQQYDRQLAKISHKMDLLRQTESDNAIKLQSMVRELNQTKNFIDRLLNDQQTVILVQKLGGEIIALNQAGCSLFEIEDYNGLTYSEIFCSDLLEDDGLAALNYLYLGGETLVKAEAQWRNSKGDVYVLLWVHALLSVPGTIDPVILSICVDITSQRKAEDRLEWLAFNDPSLINYNKQVFLEYLPFAISRSLERHKVLALLYCEISGFPQHSSIDSMDLNPLILKDLSDRMSGCLRQYDMLTQLSDDHFVIILEGLSDISDAKVVTDKIIESYAQAVEIEGQEYYLNIVIGASYAPEHTESVPELLRSAEMAMYQAQRRNENFSSVQMSQ